MRMNIVQIGEIMDRTIEGDHTTILTVFKFTSPNHVAFEDFVEESIERGHFDYILSTALDDDNDLTNPLTVQRFFFEASHPCSHSHDCCGCWSLSKVRHKNLTSIGGGKFVVTRPVYCNI